YHLDWMKWVPDDTRLSVLSLPGTHDTMALNGGDLIETQDLSLYDQLRSGLRYFDIRFRMKDDKFAIVHGISDQYAEFDDVLRACNVFLSQHPTETILLRADTTGVPDTVGCCIQYNPVNCTLTKSEIFLTYFTNQALGAYFWKPGLDYLSTNYDVAPTLGDVRGKIVLIQPWSGIHYGLSWNSLFEIADLYDLD